MRLRVVRGYNLVQILFGVGLIGCIAGFFKPQYVAYQARKQVEQVLAIMQPLCERVKAQYKAKQRWPSNPLFVCNNSHQCMGLATVGFMWADRWVLPNGTLIGRVVARVRHIHPDIDNHQIILHIIPEGVGFKIDCLADSEVPERLLPKRCISEAKHESS